MEQFPFAKQILSVIEKESSVNRDELSLEERAERKRAMKEEEVRADKICEKYKKGDVFDFSLEKNNNSYSVILEGVRVGVFAVRDAGDTTQIAFITLNKNLRNKGFGKQLYIKFNDYLSQTEGKVLMTDTMRTSDDADNLWSSFVKDGLVEEVTNAAADGHKVYRFKK